MKANKAPNPSQVYKPANIPPRVFACIDLDAFFAQCESRRLGLDDSVPLVALQWSSCWGVNYAARKYGVKSGMNINEAKKLCPKLIVAHADTVRINDGSIKQNPYERDIAEKFKQHDKLTEKVSLDLYRCESDKIFTILRRNCPVVEKGSIDEAFLDLTPTVTEILKKKEYKNNWVGKFFGGPEFAPESEEETMLMIGTQIIQKIRLEVKEELNYTCSAGIANNKMLAKLGSGMNKPFGQAILPKRYSETALKDVDIKKVRNFGRRIADAFEEHGMFKVGDIHKLNLDDITKIVGDEYTAKWVYFRAKGYDDEIIEEKDYSNKSILSNKTFGQVHNILDLQEIEDLVVTDLCVRVEKFYDESNLVPHSINLHYFDNQTKSFRVKSMIVNLRIKKENFQKALFEKAHEMVKQVSGCLFPCNMLGVSVKNFEKNDLKSYNFDLKDYIKKKQEEKVIIKENESKLPNTLMDLMQSLPMNHFSDADEPALNFDSPMKSDTSNEEKITCEKCSMQIKKDNYEDHRDFHLAEELDKELNPNKKKYKKKSSEDSQLGATQMSQVQATPPINILGVGGKKVKKASVAKIENPSNSQIMKIENFFKKK